MAGERWTEAKNALDGLANYIIDKGWDSDGIDLRFLNSTTLFQFKDINGIQVRLLDGNSISPFSIGKQDKGKVAQLLTSTSPSGGTPTGARTQTILGAHIDKLNATKGTPGYGQLKPLDLICITDGEPSTSDLPNFHAFLLIYNF
jgi:hypothetical protein